MSNHLAPAFAELIGANQQNRSFKKPLEDFGLDFSLGSAAPIQPTVGKIANQTVDIPTAKKKAKPVQQSVSQVKKVTVKKDSTTDNVTTKSTLINEDNFNTLSRIAGNLPEGQKIDIEVAGLEQLRQSILQSPPSVDLSPIFALVDSEFGSKLLAGNKPRDPRANLKAAAVITDKIISARKKQGDFRIQGMKIQQQNTIQKLLGNKSDLQILSELMNKNTKGNLNPEKTPAARRDKAIQFTQKAFNKAVEGLQKSLSATKTFADIILNGGPVGANAKNTLGPRLVGEVGNLSASEQKAFGGSKEILKGKIPRWIETLSTGEITDHDKNDFMRFIKVMKRSTEFRIGQQANRFALQGEKANTSLGIGRSIFLDSFGVQTTFPDSPALLKSRKKLEQRTARGKTGFTAADKKRMLELRRRKKLK